MTGGFERRDLNTYPVTGGARVERAKLESQWTRWGDPLIRCEEGLCD